MWFLVSYDIACSKRRSRVLKLLRAVAGSYQDSVFEVDCKLRDIQILARNIELIIDPEVDKVLFVRLSDISQVTQVGSGIQPIKGFLVVFS